MAINERDHVVLTMPVPPECLEPGDVGAEVATVRAAGAPANAAAGMPGH